jgi:hypothetical protein
MLSAFNRKGRMNPLEAMAASADPFQTMSSIFGKGTAINKAWGSKADRLASTFGDQTGFGMVMDQLRKTSRDPEWLTTRIMGMFPGIVSQQQAAALSGMDTSSQNRTMGLLRRNNITNVNDTGWNRIGAISAAGTDMGQLDAVFKDLKEAHADTTGIPEARTKGPQAYADALTKAAAITGQTKTEGEQVRDQAAALDNIKTNIGDKLVPYTLAMKDVLIQAFGRGSPTDMQARKSEVSSLKSMALKTQDVTEAEYNKLMGGDRPKAVAGVHGSGNEHTVAISVTSTSRSGTPQTKTMRTNVGAPNASGSNQTMQVEHAH